MLAVSSLLLAVSAVAAAPQAPAKCDLIDYAAWHEEPDQQWDFRWPAASAPTLTIIGAEHSRDPAHEQFTRIARNFVTAKPTLAFFEGPDRGIRADAETTIRETGEAGYVRFLAKKAAISTRSLEPSPGAQLKSLAASFPPDQVFLFFTLREAARLRDRENKSGAQLNAAMTALLAKAAKMMPPEALPFTDLAGLTAAAARYWPHRDWRTLPASWFSPLADDNKTGGVFVAAINRADSNNRNRHMVELLTAAVKSGERPFVVVGRNHVPMQAPALKCALEAPR
ncbi:MAG TPA: hypothetical protein VIL42_09375 [Sphingomicrobium sp.]|jgi:hypothetical protein